MLRFIIIFLIPILTCQKQNSSNKFLTSLEKSKKIYNPSQLKTIDSSKSQSFNYKLYKKTFIILIHGLASNDRLDEEINTGIKRLEKILKSRLKKKSIDIKDNYLDKDIIFYKIRNYHMVDSKIYDVRDEIYITIKKLISKYSIGIKNFKYQIIIIAHSMGGIYAFELAKKYRNLNIKCIFTICTPFLGTPFFENIYEFAKPGILNEFLKSETKKKLINRPIGTNSLYQAMKPKSNYLKNLKNFNDHFPKLYACGVVSKYFKNFMKPLKENKIINKILESENIIEKKLFGSDLHDCLLPLDSQIAKDYKLVNIERKTFKTNSIHNLVIYDILNQDKLIHIFQKLKMKKMQFKFCNLKKEVPSLENPEFIDFLETKILFHLNIT